MNYNKKDYDTEDYTSLRNELIGKGFDFIRILESDGRCDMVVILNFETTKIKLIK